MNKNVKKQKNMSKSMISRAIDYFCDMMMLAFAKGKIGKALASDDQSCKESRILGSLEKKHKLRTKETTYTEWIVEKSRVLKSIGSFSKFLASISFNVYGMFSIVYGVVSILMYYISIAINGKYLNGDYAFILPVILIVCGIPMLVSSASIAQVVSKSRIMRDFALSFLGLPEEKLETKVVVGGTEVTFFASIFAIIFGLFTYFLHPAYLPVVFAIIVLSCLIGANPETGVILTVAAVPFLQYTEYSTEILVYLILFTFVSYFMKRIKRRRITHWGSETVFLILFCLFVVVGSAFSRGGLITIRESVTSVVIVLGGFFLTYNLARTEKRLDTCLKSLVVIFMIICLFGLWGLLYNGFFQGAFYSIRDTVAPIFDDNLLYIADSATIFGVFAVLCIPLLVLYFTKQKNAKNKAIMLIAIMTAIIVTFIYGTFETIVAITLEIVLFTALYSRKSFKTLLAIVLIVIVVLSVYPIFSSIFDISTIEQIFSEILPLNDPDTNSRLSVTAAVRRMIVDGNLSGIGVGETAFVKSFAKYSDVVTEGATNPGSLWLQVLCWSGLGGIICFVAIVVTIIRNAISHLIFSRQKKIKVNVLALLCSFFVMLVFGMTNCIWNDCRTLYVFWMCAGLLMGYIRRANDVENKRLAQFENGEYKTDIELNFYVNPMIDD